MMRYSAHRLELGLGTIIHPVFPLNEAICEQVDGALPKLFICAVVSTKKKRGRTNVITEQNGCDST